MRKNQPIGWFFRVWACGRWFTERIIESMVPKFPENYTIP